MRSGRLLLALVLCAAPGAATAQAPGIDVDLAAEADLQFDLGVERYRAGDYRGALEHLLTSNRLVPNRNVVFNIARCYEQLGRFPEAYRQYADFYEAEKEPGPREEARVALERIRPHVALVELKSDPPGASIFVDRRDLGARGLTPKTLAVAPGEHTVTIELAGHEPAVVPKIVATTGQSAPVEVKLVKILGAVEVTGEPAGAEIRLDAADGPVVARLPARLDLPPGPHTLHLSAPGRRPGQVPVNVVAKQQARVSATLDVLTGTVVVDADEAGALVEIDGQPAGFAPTVVPSVPVGRHTVRVSLPGFKPHERAIELEPEARLSLQVELEPVYEVTAASRSTESVDAAPASVTLITDQEIRAFGYETLYEALAGARGVFQTDDRTYQSLGFRGFSRPGDYGNHVLVLLDGHTMNDDYVGSSYVGQDFQSDLGMVERIEVVRGPGSVLYGTNAFFGVVNVVTRDASSVPRPQASVAASGDGVARLRLAGGQAVTPEAGYWLAASGARGEGEDLHLRFFEEPRTVDRESRDADGFRSATVQGRAWLGDLTFQANYNLREKRIPTGAFGTLLADTRATSDDDRGFAELRYDTALGERLEVFARGWADYYSFRGDYPYLAIDDGVQTDSWDGLWSGAEARTRIRIAEPFRLTVGGEGRFGMQADLKVENEAGTVLEGEAKFQVYSGYLIADYEPVRWLSLSAGARLDHFSTTGSAISPRLAALLRPADDGVLKLIAGQAFRAPSVYEREYHDNGQSLVQAGTLEEEVVRTAEAEYTHRLSPELALIGDVFFNQISHLIDQRKVPQDGVAEESWPDQYYNLSDDTSTLGAELEVRREWRRGWMFGASYSFQRTRVGGLGGDDELTNSPVHLFGLKHAAPIGRSGATIANRLRAETGRLTESGDRTDGAVFWDTTVSGTLPDAHLSYGLGVRNLFDWRHEHPVGSELRPLRTVPQPGRTFYATLTAEY